MTYWSYDSYCTEDVYDYIEQFDKKELFLKAENDMIDYINNEISEIDYEFVLGVSIYCIRSGCSFSEDYLRKLRNVIDYLLIYGNFDYWENKDKRKEKIKHERLIINNLIRGNKLKFGKLIIKGDNSNLKLTEIQSH